MKKIISLLIIMIVLIATFFTGCQKDTNQLEKVDIIVNAVNEIIDINSNSIGIKFTVCNNSDKYIVVSYFDDVYGENYLTVDEAPYTIIEPQTTNFDFGYGYEYSNQKEYEEIISQINKEYHFRVYLCDKNYLNSDNPIHDDIYRDIIVGLGQGSTNQEQLKQSEDGFLIVPEQ